MQNTQEPDLGAEMLGIGGNLQHRLGAGLEQKLKQTLLVLPDQRDQGMGHTEDQMVVAHRQQLPLARR